MKNIGKVLMPLGVLVLSIFVVNVMVNARPAPEKKATEERVVSLFVDPVESAVVKLDVNTQGEVRPKTEIDLISRVSGHVVSVAGQFAAGGAFDSNTVLVKIDDTDYRLALVRAEARVAEARTSVEREKANATIKRNEWRQRGGSEQPSDFALNKPQVAEAQAKLAAAQADLDEARLNIERTEIKVPFNGRVMLKNIGVGQYVSAGAVLGRVFSTDAVEMKLPLTDTQLAELNLSIGFNAEHSPAPEVIFQQRIGNRQHQWRGRIVRTHASVDQQTRLIYAIAEVQDPYGEGADRGQPLAVGMFVSAVIQGVQQQQAMSLPREALRNADKVYVVNDEDRLEIRTVEVLSSNEESVLISAGVEAGERVVTSTIPVAVEGMRVRAMQREINAVEVASIDGVGA